MNLRDLVGRMAIRTDKVREVMPWEMERAFRLDFMVPVPIFDREKYMDEPVRILAVEGTQVVIEEDGKRKLLERRYIDEHWTDYERLLHPEEEEKEKAEKLMKEFEVAAEPIKHFLAEHYDPMCTAVINRASEGTCRQCGRRILWVRMKSGKNMPVDMALHNYKKDSTGKEKIVTPDGEVLTGRILVGERGDGAGYISHFASCKKYRR